jgi:hypothetical protein
VVREVAERDLNADALIAEPARIADQTADRHPGCGQPSDQRQSDRPGGPGE